MVWLGGVVGWGAVWWGGWGVCVGCGGVWGGFVVVMREIDTA